MKFRGRCFLAVSKQRVGSEVHFLNASLQTDGGGTRLFITQTPQMSSYIHLSSLTSYPSYPPNLSELASIQLFYRCPSSSCWQKLESFQTPKKLVLLFPRRPQKRMRIFLQSLMKKMHPLCSEDYRPLVVVLSSTTITHCNCWMLLLLLLLLLLLRRTLAQQGSFQVQARLKLYNF